MSGQRQSDPSQPCSFPVTPGATVIPVAALAPIELPLIEYEEAWKVIEPMGSPPPGC